jgi:hypothetical protein
LEHLNNSVRKNIRITSLLFSYIAYGLGIHSFLPFPELPFAKTRGDVIFRPGKLSEANFQMIDDARHFKATANEAYYALTGVATFLVREGKEVIVDLQPGADERIARLCLLGPVAAIILHQKGRLTLHASSVAVDGKGIAFLGPPGCGKSTLAAAFYRRGYEMLADDVTAIYMDSDAPRVIPAFPQFKLWPDSIIALGDVPERLPAVHPDFAKRSLKLNGGFAHFPVPLKAIYVLAPGPQVDVEPLGLQDAMKELIGHSYVTRFGNELLQETGMTLHFKRCVYLIQNANWYRFRRPRSLSSLDEHISRVISELANTR